MTRDIDQVMPDRRDVMKGTAAAAGALLLPGGAIAQGTPRKGGVLRVAMPYNPGSVDPMTGRNLTDFNVLYGVFDALVDFEPLTLELKPGLAKTWKFTDLKTLVLDLVDGVKFHDGTPFNAEAVKFNLERYKNDPRSNVKSDLGTVDKVEVTGPSQVTIRLNKPNVGLPTILTNRVGLMVSPTSIQEKGPNVDRNPVGTGPFKFVSWQDNDSFVLTRNENYWRPGLPYLDGINMRIISELNTVARTVIAGETDVALNLQPQQKVVADRSPNVVTKVFPSLVPYGAFINYSRPPLDDMRIRQALNYAINRDEINKVAALGLGQVSSTILSKSLWACDPATANYYTHDVDKAKKLLAEAGHPDGIEIESIGWPDQTAMQRQELDHLAARQGRHPRQADGAVPAAGRAGVHDRQERRDVRQPVVAVRRSKSVLRKSVRQRRTAQRRPCRAAGFSRAPGRHHGYAGAERAQGGVCQAAAVRGRKRVADGAIHRASDRRDESPRCKTIPTACRQRRSSPRSGCLRKDQ